MLRKRIIKILSVLVAVIIAFSCCCISASATTTYNFAMTRPQINNNSCYFEIVTEGESCFVFYVSIALQNMGLHDNIDSDRFSVNFSTKFENGNLWVFPSDISSLADVSEITFEDYDIYGVVFNQNGSTWQPTIVWDDTINQDGYSVGIFIGSNFKCVRAYNAEFYSSSSWECIFAYGNEVNTNEKLDSIISGIQGGNQQIIDNANQNAQQIQQNQNENTDKVLNGWDGSGKSPDNTKTDEYQNVEGEIDSVTADSRSASISLFNNFGNILSNLQFQKGLLAVSKLMTDLFSIDWFATIIQFALVVGSFAFILGMASFVIGRFSSSNSKGSKKKG